MVLQSAVVLPSSSANKVRSVYCSQKPFDNRSSKKTFELVVVVSTIWEKTVEEALLWLTMTTQETSGTTRSDSEDYHQEVDDDK
jgi:hypothetical protein